MKSTKSEAIKIIVACAEKYCVELENRSLLFLCLDKNKHLVAHEFFFNGYNFMHLTGVKVSSSQDQMSANLFYEKCLSHKLSPNDFEFAEDGTTILKLQVLPTLMDKRLSASMIGNFDSNRPRLYTDKLAGSVKACMGFIMDGSNGQYVPNTVLQEDIRNYVGSYARVIGVFRKHNQEDGYSEVTYRASNVEWDRICVPPKYECLMNILTGNPVQESCILDI